MTTSWQHQREALAFVKDKPGSMLAHGDGDREDEGGY